MDLLQKFRRNWEKLKWHNRGQTILIAVSGGIDSMVMAQLFLQSSIPLAVAHCNFQLRGTESDLDEQLVTEWCTNNNLQLHVIRFDTTRFSQEWKKGTQETARILRYEWFEKIRKEFKYARIATAHHADDNVETMLINLFKGTGIAGIHGILPDSGAIIRPLLFARKMELTEWAQTNGIISREDASNASDDYLRNAVRHNIVPVIEELFPAAVERVSESITRFAEVEALYKKAIAAERKKLLELRGQDYYIPVLKLRLCNPINTITYELLHPFGFSSSQVEHVLQLMNSESGHFVNSSTHRVIRNRDFLIITTFPTETTDFILIENSPCTVATARHRYSFSILPRPEKIDADPAVAFIDLKNITFPLILRRWKTGDYFYPIGMKMKKKKVSRVLINEKIPLHEKEHIMVLECKKKIAWLPGIRLDERFKIKETTEKVLVVRRVAL